MPCLLDANSMEYFYPWCPFYYISVKKEFFNEIVVQCWNHFNQLIQYFGPLAPNSNQSLKKTVTKRIERDSTKTFTGEQQKSYNVLAFLRLIIV